MSSVVFDKLWDEAFEREGELMQHAYELAQIYRISSAMAAIRLARALEESGRPFFQFCEDMAQANERLFKARVKRVYHLDDYQMQLLEQYLKKMGKAK